MSDDKDKTDEPAPPAEGEGAPADGAPRKKRRGAVKREFDPSRWAHLIFVLGGFVGAWVLAHAIEDIWDIIWSYYPQIGRPDSMQANIAAIVIALSAAAYCWRRKDYFKYCTEVIVEISQVTWPTRAEVRAATMVVIVITLICSVLLFGMDQVWSSATNMLYGI